MALARCEEHGPPIGRTNTYTYRHDPVSHPDSGLVCGITGCDKPAHVWITADEERLYSAGQRVFELPTQAIKVRLVSVGVGN